MKSNQKQNAQNSTDLESGKAEDAKVILQESQMLSLDKTKLTSLHPGCVAVICDMQAVSSDVNRLKAMGICIGRTVQVIQRGDPLIVCVLGTRLGISARLAHEIIVQTCGSDYAISANEGRGAI